MIVSGQDEVVATLIQKMTGIRIDPPFTSLAILENDEFVGGVIYNQYIKSPFGEPISIEMSIAALDKKWATRHNLRGLFSYPFIQLGVKRVQATTNAGNARVRKFLERLGFTFEGIGRESYPLGGDSVMYSMLKPECKWIDHGLKTFCKPPSCTQRG